MYIHIYVYVYLVEHKVYPLLVANQIALSCQYGLLGQVLRGLRRTQRQQEAEVRARVS